MWNSYISNNTGVSIGLDFSKEDYFIELNSADFRKKVSPFNQLPKGAFYDIKYFDKLNSTHFLLFHCSNTVVFLENHHY